MVSSDSGRADKDSRTVFEGLAHPYKDNLVKFNGKTHIVRQTPEVTMSIEAIKPAVQS